MNNLVREHNLVFHHIGVACKSIETEKDVFFQLGYLNASEIFEDKNQGVRGLFVESKNQPRLELLENLDGFSTLNPFLEKGNKFYHVAYETKDIENTKQSFNRNRWATLSPIKDAVYFKRVCFLVDRTGTIIELVERASPSLTG